MLTPKDSTQSSRERHTVVEAALQRIALSQGQPAPTGPRMALLVADATRLWKEIPTGEIHDAVDEGLIQAGNFPCTIGGVAKAWRERKPSEKRFLGAGRMNESETMNYLAWLDECGRISEDEREEENRRHREFFGGLANKLKGAG